MPYCEPCARHFAPSALTTDGACPTCGRVLEQPKLARDAAALTGERAEGDQGDAVPKAPWHFKLLLGALVVYLGFRALQGVEWVAHRL